MAEPIRKPIHRPRPPHPHTQSRPQAVPVRGRLLPQELDPTPLPPAPLTLLPPPPQVRTAPPPPDSRPDPLPTPPAALAPPEDLPPLSATSGRETRERSARGLLLAALALHGGVLLTALPGLAGDPAFDLGPAELVLAGCVLLSGGMMLVLGRR